MVSDSEETFLGRWSNRKIQNKSTHDGVASVEKVQSEDSNVDESEVKSFNENFEGLNDTEILQKLGLKNPDDLTSGDSFKEFMNKSVPEHLRKRALRRLWRSNPILANLDGMNEYDEDFTLATSALQEFATNYVVGKGFLGQFKNKISDSEDSIDQPINASSSSVRLNKDVSDDETDSISGKTNTKSGGEDVETDPVEKKAARSVSDKRLHTKETPKSSLDALSKDKMEDQKLNEEDANPISRNRYKSRKPVGRMKFSYKSG